MILKKDYYRVHKDNAAQNLNAIKKIVLNTLKKVDFSDIVNEKNMLLRAKQNICCRQ